MARIVIDCADPSDLEALANAAEQAAGHCNVTYAKHAQALIDAGTVKSERQAAAKIAEETGENPDSVRKMIQRGKKKVETPVPTQQPPQRQPVSYAMDFVDIAISQLRRIEKSDPMRVEAIKKVINWIATNHLDVFDSMEEDLKP